MDNIEEKIEEPEITSDQKRDETFVSSGANEETVTTSEEKPRNKKKIALIVVAVLLVVGVGGGIAFYALNQNKGEEEAQNSEVVSDPEEKPTEHTEEEIKEPEITKTAMLPTGEALNKKFCELSGSVSEFDFCEDNRIVSIQRMNSIPDNKKTRKYDVTDSDSEASVYFWYELNEGTKTGTIYYYSEAKTIYANKVFDGAFKKLMALSDISGLASINMSKVESAADLFADDEKLKTVKALKNWDMSNVTKMDGMFMRAGLTNISGLADWDVSKVQSFEGLFMSVEGLSDISVLKNWDMSSAGRVSDMFYGCNTITDISAVSNWKTSNFKEIGGMFADLTELKDISPLKNWDTSNVYHASSLFSGDSSLSDISPIANWNMKKLKASYAMFRDTDVYDATVLNAWKVPNLDFKDEMFNEGAKTPKWYK